jgi:hypothetical protein
MKIIINEQQYKNLVRVINKELLSEQDLKSIISGQLKNFQDKFLNMDFSLSSSDDDDYDYDNNSLYSLLKGSKSNISDESGTKVISEPGSYFVHPEYEKIKINYGADAKPLNKDAEILLKSIVAETGYDSIRVGSTLRDYNLQAIVNKTNTESQMKEWYCTRGKEDCDELIKNWKQKDASELAKYYEMRDKKYGKPMSNHILDFAIDVPYDTKMANTIEKIIKKGDSGIKRVYPEKGNALHIEFLFPVTGISGVKTPTISKLNVKDGENVIDKGDMIIVTNNKNSNDYALVYGGIPKEKHGGRFMYEQGKYVSKLKNKNIVYSNHDIPINIIESDLKKINPNSVIKTVSGFSAGQKYTLPAMRTGNYKFIGLIDPYISNYISSLPANTKMISNHNVWKDYPEAVTALKQMEDLKISKFENIPHLEMPKKFFEEYGHLM